VQIVHFWDVSSGRKETVQSITENGLNRMYQATLTGRFEKALVVALKLHEAQLRKGTAIPYFAHLLGVASLVLEYGGDEEEAIAALLHDAVEDQGGIRTLDTIRRRFGDRVAEIVLGCTDADTIPKPPWRERKVVYLKHLRTAPASVCLVSAADKLNNARAILADYRTCGEKLWKRFNGGREGTFWYYRALVNIFKKKGPRRMADELERVVTELEALAGQP
jgi:(p)ppGpp synthase/HD superfamily hydrolase